MYDIRVNVVSSLVQLLIVYMCIYLESRAHTRWQKVHTMEGAKIALELLFKHVTESRRKQCVKEYEYNELQVCIFENYRLFKSLHKLNKTLLSSTSTI